MKRRTWILLGVFGGLACIWVSCSMIPLLRFRREIKAACDEADRLVIDFNVVPGGGSLQSKLPVMPTVTIGGADKVKEFANVLDFKPTLLGWHCMCLGELSFRLDRSGESIGKLTLHHGESLRWCSRDARNFELTASSRERLRDWMERNGGQALKDAQEEAAAIWKRLGDEQMAELEAAVAATTSSAPAP